MGQQHGDHPTTEPIDLTLREAASFLRLSPHVVILACAMRQLPCRRRGRRVFIPRDELLRALATGGERHDPS